MDAIKVAGVFVAVTGTGDVLAFKTGSGLPNGRRAWEQTFSQAEFWRIADFVAKRRPTGQRLVTSEVPDLFPSREPLAVGRPIVPLPKVKPAGADPEAPAPLPDLDAMPLKRLREFYGSTFRRSPKGMSQADMIAAIREKRGEKAAQPATAAGAPAPADGADGAPAAG